jgi:hypothetical protein
VPDAEARTHNLQKEAWGFFVLMVEDLGPSTPTLIVTDRNGVEHREVVKTFGGISP